MFSRILIDVDALADRHPALDQGRDLAAKDGSAITIVDVLPEIPPAVVGILGAGIEAELVAHRRECLAALAAAPGPSNIETRLLRVKPAVAIVQEVRRGGHDLLIRSHGRDLTEPPPPFGPVDLQLLRTCPCPVWLVAPNAALPPRRLLAAVDVADPAPEAAALNRAIVELGAAIRELEQGDLTVLHVWQVFGRSLLASHMTEPDLAEYVAAATRETARTFDEFRASLGPLASGAAFELLEGEPHQVVADQFTRGRFDLVIMGTVARTGLAGLLMGNTAERVLREIRGSVLAVKPAGFEVDLR
jgi:nucleotide-binding universal stress UspA family protein